MAHVFASHGDDCIITGRRSDRLDALQQELENKYNIAILPLCFDVQDKKAVDAAITSLPDEWKQIDILINNAGLAAGRDWFDEANMDDWETMIDTNVKGLLFMTKAVVPFMTVRKRGHIINIGSTAAKEVYEKGNVYCATKSAVDALSQSMRIDLLRHGIKVTAVHPGAAETEFSLVRLKGDEQAAKAVYQGIEPLVGEDVAQVVYYATTLPEHVCINDLVMTCTAQANSFYFNRK
jgi:NADP-dependent 3-hydroxy acid dehydrogenase YdfG